MGISEIENSYVKQDHVQGMFCYVIGVISSERPIKNLKCYTYN